MRNSIFVLLFLTSSVNAQTPDEQTKILALKLGYALNGNSMVRWGTIDLTIPKPPMQAQTEKKKPSKK